MILFKTIIAELRYRLGGWKTDAVEVLGNIHDHPYLLEASEDAAAR